jgi:hypothetical protein
LLGDWVAGNPITSYLSGCDKLFATPAGFAFSRVNDSIEKHIHPLIPDHMIFLWGLEYWSNIRYKDYKSQGLDTFPNSLV